MMDHQFDTTEARGLHARSARAVASSSTPRINAQAIAQRLTGAKKKGNGWVACCPAHDDRTPSLSIIDGDKGPVWKCRAGCSNAQVTAALKAREIWSVGTTSAAPFQPATPKPKAKPADDWVPMVPPPENAPAPDAREWRGYNRVHEYRGQDGELLFYVRRKEATATTKKLFHPLVYGELTDRKTGEVKTGWHPRHADTPRPLYRLDALAARPDATVLLCEGEKSAEAAQTLFPDHVAMTWPGGSGAVAQADWTPLHDRQVIIWPDNDQAGHKAATQVQNILPHASIIRVDDLPDGHDAADVSLENAADWLADRAQAPAPRTTPQLELVTSNAEPEEWAEQQTRRAQNWRDELDKNDQLKIIANLANTIMALEHAPELAGSFARDEMMRSTMLVKPLFMRNRQHQARPIEDNDVTVVRAWLQRNGMPRLSAADVQEAVNHVAHKNKYHPIRDYLDSLQWDGKPRLDTWLHRYLGADPNNEQAEYLAAVGAKFFLALVERVRKPGCKSDYMLVLEGPQGARKSTACKIIGGEWFSDTMPDIASNDQVRVSMHLRGKWLIEVAELSSINRSDVERFKSFTTSREEKYTPKYGRNEVTEPRQCVFIGTTNNPAYILDPSGGRRFWPVKVGTIDTDALERDRDQLFAEASHRRKAGEAWWPDSDFELLHMKPQQEQRTDVDEWENLISEWLERSESVSEITVSNIAKSVLEVPEAKLDKVTQRRISDALTRIGWERHRSNGKRLWRKKT